MHRLSFLACLAALAACAGAGPPAISSAASACPVAGSWSNEVTGLGVSVWTISADGAAREAGIGDASGRASVQDRALRIDWTTGGYAGFYEVTLDASCRSGHGQMTWTRTPQGVEARSFSINMTRR